MDTCQSGDEVSGEVVLQVSSPWPRVGGIWRLLWQDKSTRAVGCAGWPSAVALGGTTGLVSASVPHVRTVLSGAQASSGLHRCMANARDPCPQGDT